MASRNDSPAGNAAATRCSTLPCAGDAEKLRETLSVRIVIGCGVDEALVRPIETAWLALSQRTANSGCRSAGPKAAIEAPAWGM